MTVKTPIQASPTAGSITSEHNSPKPRPRKLRQTSPAPRAEAARAEARGPLFRLLVRLLEWLSGPAGSANDWPGGRAGLDEEAAHEVDGGQHARHHGGVEGYGPWCYSGPWALPGPF